MVGDPASGWPQGTRLRADPGGRSTKLHMGKHHGGGDGGCGSPKLSGEEEQGHNPWGDPGLLREPPARHPPRREPVGGTGSVPRGWLAVRSRGGPEASATPHRKLGTLGRLLRGGGSVHAPGCPSSGKRQGARGQRETAFGWDFSVTEPSRCAQESSSVTWDVGRGRVPASTTDALGQTETRGWPRGLQATTLQGLLHTHSAGLPGAWSPPPRASPRGPRQPRQPRPPPVSLGDRSVKRACGTSCAGSSGSQRRVWSPGRLPAPCLSWGRGNRAPRASHSETTDVYCSQL